MLAQPVYQVRYPLDGRDLGVLPQAAVLGRDAAVRLHRGGLDDGQTRAVDGELAVVCEVEVGEVPVSRRIHAHGRYRNPMGEVQ